MRALIRDEVNRIREDGAPYEGAAVFIDRDAVASGYADRPDQHREDLSVYRLYTLVHRQAAGCLTVGDQPVWLVTCQVPNQGHYSRRAADLLGVRPDGSLVVFECKVANSSDTPFVALLEGLDYLAHLMIDQNFERLEQGFAEWRHGHATPTGFENVSMNLNGRHSVTVLAPQAYFDAHRLDSTGIEQDWEFLCDRHWHAAPCIVELEFAVTDYTAAPCTPLRLSTVSR
ncbi:MAG TPA: hypothetical protein VGG64_08125 [Pirellulales bacterium]|jgi:hypothetical protein